MRKSKIERNKYIDNVSQKFMVLDSVHIYF